jgi:hypothetical protein
MSDNASWVLFVLSTINNSLAIITAPAGLLYGFGCVCRHVYVWAWLCVQADLGLCHRHCMCHTHCSLCGPVYLWNFDCTGLWW